MQSATVHVSPTTSAVCSTADRVHTPFASDVDLLRDLDGIIDLNAQMAHDALDLRAPEAEISNRAKKAYSGSSESPKPDQWFEFTRQRNTRERIWASLLVRLFSRNW